MAKNFSKAMLRGVLLKGSLLGFLFVGSFSQADDMDAYVAFSGNFIQSLSKMESGTRGGGKLEFARLQRWVSMDIRLAAGNHYTDYGAVLKIYKHWRFDPDNSATGISLGAGPGILSSGGVDNGTYADGTAKSDGAKRGFMDIVIHPFTRFVWDTGRGFGMVADLGLDIIPRRSYSDKDDRFGGSDNRMRYRVQGSVGIALAVD